jgi:predicted DCC family thiol-disulfide oxidoreductase YuxK
VSANGPAITLVFYDGVCGLCDKFVQFLLARDPAGRVRFAQLQGDLARRELIPHGHDPADLDSVFAIANWQTPRQRVLFRSEAVLHIVSRLGGPWGALARLAQLIPSAVADVAYRTVARRRYRLFGRFDSCPLPRPEWRNRFLD